MPTGISAAWVAILLTLAAGLVGYGALTQRVASAEEAIRDAKPIVERLATLEANQQNTASAVNAVQTDVRNLNTTVQSLILELQRQRQSSVGASVPRAPAPTGPTPTAAAAPAE